MESASRSAVWLFVGSLACASAGGGPAGDGRTSGVTLSWRDLSYTVGDRVILSNVSGTATPGRLLAIMGPSGSGKTSALNALAGQTKATPKARLTGQLLVNGVPVGGSAAGPGVVQAYVRQEDTFYTQMTVRETLMFAARLRLPREMPIADKEKVVDRLIEKLSLIKVADTLVGDVSRRGISGGERKRLAIGCELLGNPNLLYLDEPTSGLDSFQAQKVVESLRVLAEEGCTIVMAIHQPRSSIFSMFDDLILLAEGKTVYQGPAKGAASHFSRLGFPVPNGVSAAEHVVDLVSVDYDTEQLLAESEERIRRLEAGAPLPKPLVLDRPPAAEVVRGGGGVVRRRRPRFVSSGVTQFRLLFRRAWREVSRSRAALAIKVAQQLMIALIYGNIYQLGKSQSSIQDRFGLISLISIGAGNLAIASTVRAFPKEKTIVMAERAQGSYGILPYFLAKMLAEAPVSAVVSALGGGFMYPLVGLQRSWPKFLKFCGTLVLEGFASGGLGLFLGAAAPSTDVALALFPPVLVLMIIFNGFNIAEANTPKLLRWMPQASFIRWCSEGLAVNEFSGLKFDRPAGASAGRPYTATGEQALERVSFHKSTVRKAAVAQTGIIAGTYLGSLAMLQRNRQKFLSVLPPVIAS